MDYHISIYIPLLSIIILLEIWPIVIGKCLIEKESTICFGFPKIRDISTSNNSIEVLKISRCSTTHQNSNQFDLNFVKNLSKLKLLSVTECKLERLPIIHHQINSIEVLYLSHNLLNERSQNGGVGMNFFQKFPNLKILDLSNNKLRDLPKSWFDYGNNLEILILNHNFIRGLDPLLSLSFTNLRKLHLRNNEFVMLKKFKELKLSEKNFGRNSLELIIDKRPKRFQPQIPLNTRHKMRKEVVTIENYTNIIPQFTALETLDLAFNKISTLDQIPLLDLHNLTTLILRGNRLGFYLELGSTEGHCDFGTAPFYIKSKSGLVHLDLSDNLGLTRIQICWTFGLQNLQTLEISNCSISSIADSAFDKMKKLSKLDLSHNKLHEVPKELTAVSKTLTNLNLSKNNLSQLKSFHLLPLENLQTLNLSHNQFENFLVISAGDLESSAQENLLNFPLANDSPGLDEPVSLLSRMGGLRDVDLSYNNFTKISAITDLSPSIKTNGGIWRINLAGNPQLSQLADFNYKDITPTLKIFSLSNHSNLGCNCHLNGFINWLLYRKIEVSVNCGSPDHLAGQPITSSSVLQSIINNKNCNEKSQSKTLKPIYRLKISTNANQTADSLLDGGLMNSNIKKTSNNNKRQNHQQKWTVIGANLKLRCEFYSNHQMFFSPTIKWQRTKMLPVQNGQHNTDNSNQQINYPFLKIAHSELVGPSKFREKVESLNSQYDPRMKVFQIGPFDDKIDLEIFEYSWSNKILKNLTLKSSGKAFKYVGYLLINSIQSSDFGQYQCLVSDLPVNQFYGQNPLISQEEEIKIYTPPTFTATPSNPMSIIEGETAEITCKAQGYPPPLTSLGRIGSKDFPAARGRRMVIYKDDSSFIIDVVRQIDAGNYSCTSRNPAGIIFYNFTLKVQIPASFVETGPSKISIRIGHPLIIKFKIKGIPTPIVKWFKDGIPINGSDRINFNSDYSMLIIQSSTVEDTGLYKITILNALGGSETLITVKMFDKPGSSYKSSESNWMSDYWLSAIIIIVVLSILLTSILWIAIFLCFGKLIRSKKRRLLLISNSQSKCGFDKRFSSTNNFTNRHSLPSKVCHIPMSLTTSTIVRHDRSVEETHNIDDSDLMIDNFKNGTKFCSTQIVRNCLPEPHYRYTTNVQSFPSQPYFSTSKSDLSNFLSQSSSETHYPFLMKNELGDNGIHSDIQKYCGTLNGSSILSIYKCRHKSKHKINGEKQKLHENVKSTEFNEEQNSLTTENLKV